MPIDADLLEGLAKHLAAAYLAHQMDIGFDAAMRKYVQPYGQVGEPWRAAARFIFRREIKAQQSCPITSIPARVQVTDSTAAGKPILRARNEMILGRRKV